MDDAGGGSTGRRQEERQPRLVVVVDSRERRLVQELSSLQKGDRDSSSIAAEHLDVKPLDLGDVQFRVVFPGGEKEPEDDVIFERKTLADLGASIKDGRYAEQKARLLSCRRGTATTATAPIVYVLENCASFSELQRAAVLSGLHPAALESAVYNLMFRHAILVMTTSDVRDTAAFVEAVWRRRQTHLFVSSDKPDRPDGGIGTEAALLAASTASKRNKNITRDTCYLMQLCQVPGVSGKTAKHIAAAWPSMAELYRGLSGKTRGERVRSLTALPTLGKKSAESISSFLFCDDDDDDDD